MKFIELDECTSTNDIAWEKGLLEKSMPLLISTEKQTKGRGRQGRSWFMSARENIACSLFVPAEFIPQELRAWLSVVAGISAYEVLEKLLPKSGFLRLKWPNDLYFNQFKIGGILCETKLQGSTLLGAVIGLGINVTEFPVVEELKTSSLCECGLIDKKNSLEFKTAFLKSWSEHFLNLLNSKLKTTELIHKWKACAKLDQYSTITTHDGSGTLVDGKIIDLILSDDGLGKLKVLETKTGKVFEI